MKTKFIGGILLLSAVLLATSCERGVDEESFVSGVTNAQLESPKIDDSSFSTLTNSDGTESVKVTWPVIEGAGGYLFNVLCTSNPEDESVSSENPLVIVQDSIIDGCSVTFAKIEDAVYNISLKTLGNEKLNNKDAAEATTFAYSALVPATTIPAGSDIAEFIKDNLQDSDKEQGFALEAGASYTLNSKVDFGLNQVTLRSTATDGVRPTVTVGAEGTLMTQAGLKVKFINFDCTASGQKAFLLLSDNPDASISTESLGYKANGANQNGFVINKPVLIQDCNFKNINNSFLFGNKKPWSLRDFRIMNSILQFNNSGSQAMFDLSGGGNGLIKNFMIKNSTIYNIQEESGVFFIKYSSGSNAQPKKIFGTNDDSAIITFANSTFFQTNIQKRFADQAPNYNKYVADLKNNIFYDCWALNKFIQSQFDVSACGGNILFGEKTKLESNDLKYTNGTELDPQFAGPTAQELDLTQENGGVNFKPQASGAADAGDPRWK